MADRFWCTVSAAIGVAEDDEDDEDVGVVSGEGFPLRDRLETYPPSERAVVALKVGNLTGALCSALATSAESSTMSESRSSLMVGTC